MNEKLELRMYGLVPFNISPIQQAIQFGHAVVDYGQKIKMPQSLNKMSLEKKIKIIQRSKIIDNRGWF